MNEAAFVNRVPVRRSAWGCLPTRGGGFILPRLGDGRQQKGRSVKLATKTHRELRIDSRRRIAALDDLLMLVYRMDGGELARFVSTLRCLRDYSDTMIEGQAMLLREALRR